MPSHYLGVDPGAAGAMVLLRHDRAVVHMVPLANLTPADLWTEVRKLAATASTLLAALEKVGGYVGGAGNPGSGMFKFGRGYGHLEMALLAADISREEVPPARWQRGLNIPPRKRTETRTAWKNRLKAKAQALFPREHVTLATADALLIAEFARRTYGDK